MYPLTEIWFKQGNNAPVAGRVFGPRRWVFTWLLLSPGLPVRVPWCSMQDRVRNLAGDSMARFIAHTGLAGNKRTGEITVFLLVFLR
jgi:hypothetical protein